jgi:hypothetical protein
MILSINVLFSSPSEYHQCIWIRSIGRLSAYGREVLYICPLLKLIQILPEFRSQKKGKTIYIRDVLINEISEC